MRRFTSALGRIHTDESGHAEVGVPTLVTAVAAIGLTIGAATDTDWLTWVGGVALGLGLLVSGFARHRFVDYILFGRLDKLEK